MRAHLVMLSVTSLRSLSLASSLTPRSFAALTRLSYARYWKGSRKTGQNIPVGVAG